MKSSTERPYLWLFAILAITGFILDQTSKYGVFAYLYTEEPLFRERPHITIVEGVFQLEALHTHERDLGDDWRSPLRTISGPCLPHVNRGALFGIGNGDRESGGANSIFAVISVLAAGFIIGWAYRPIVAKDWLLSLALGLILGGTLGNLYDRVVFGGVRDFLHCWYGELDNPSFDWPVFNIADCALVCGAALLLLHSFFVQEQVQEPVKAEQAEVSASMQTASPLNGALESDSRAKLL
jgi:lipoprotein signal peptidase